MAQQVQSVPLQISSGGISPWNEQISRDVAYQLIRASDEELPKLLSAARDARDRFKPGVITYSRKVFIPLTNLCRDY
jgi:FO synthase